MENNTALLAQLKDLHQPPAVSWWPLAPGWYLVILLVALVIIGATLFSLKQWHRYRRRQAILAELESLQVRYHNAHEMKLVIPQLSILIRRIAIATDSREKIAGLNDQDWLGYLDKATGTRIFTQGAGKLLNTAPYQKNPTGNLDEVFTALIAWIKRGI